MINSITAISPLNAFSKLLLIPRHIFDDRPPTHHGIHTMPTNLTTTYLLPAILLNPVLFLHSLNTILSRILPPVLAATTPPAQPYCHLGPSPTSPHLNMHVSDNLCWSYTIFMVFAQLLAFGRVSQRRQTVRDRKDALRSRKEDAQDSYFSSEMNGWAESNGGLKVNGTAGMNGIKRDRLEGTMAPDREDMNETDETDETTEEEEMML